MLCGFEPPAYKAIKYVVPSTTFTGSVKTNSTSLKVFEQFDGYTLSDVAINSHLGFSLVESSINFHILALIAPGLPV